ncbi:amino acid permease [Oryzifoliimicrobium ureilyticus]|uniref:amino acid permease n=1 Tax=Oryzifoliimicrobium ureilyticus TaxID=3113724 RepID=UPI0030760E6B
MSDYTENDKHQDLQVLHSMGYAQELERRMSSFSNFAISFSIICILSGGINSLAQATAGAGGAAIGIGWPLGCLISGVFALGMAQIASAYPTAGGLYHWGSILGNRFTGWLTAWFNLLGLVTVLGAINAGTWGFFSGSIAGWFGINVDTTTSAGFANQIIFVAMITAVQALINHLGIKLTAKLTDFSGYLIFATAIALTLVCLFGASSWEISRLWTFTNYSGLPQGDAPVWPHTEDMWYIFALGLLLPIYTITGYDASAHTSEETVKAAHSVPRGMVSSVIWSAFFGYLMLVAFVLAIPNMDDAAKQGWNVFFWTLDSVGNPFIVKLLYVAIFVSQFLCGLATVTSVSRMIFAFSRDGGLPASKLLASVSRRYRTPSIAIWVGSVASVLFVWGASLVTIAGSSAYTIVVSCTVIFLFLSFAIPIALGISAIGTAKWPKMGPWDMGAGLYRVVAGLVILSMIVIFVIGVQPPNQWALYITVGFLILTGIVWVAFENRRFKGPPIGEEVARRKAEIAAAEAAIGER